MSSEHLPDKWYCYECRYKQGLLRIEGVNAVTDGNYEEVAGAKTPE
jgi:hypothetical protein